MVKQPALIPIVGILDDTKRGVSELVLINFNNKTTFNLFINTHDQQEHTEHKFIMEAQLIKPLILPINAKLYFTNSFSLLLQTRMVLHPIYQQLMEAGYNPLVYQLLLKGCFYTPFTINYWKGDTTPL